MSDMEDIGSVGPFDDVGIAIELRAERDRYREALQEIADIEGDQGPGRIAADALRASGIDPFAEAGKR